MKTTVEAIELLRAGKVVAVPTETVYGLAADALNPSAIARIFEVKNRPSDNPLICHFQSIEQVQEFVTEIPVTTLSLMKRFAPGPISFMLDLPENSPLKFATCGSPQVIARIPDHPVFLDIIKELNRPVAAPSANTSGRISPTSAQMVEEDLGNKIEGVVDGGISNVGIESTIVDARSDKEIFILRHGAIGEDEIHKILPEAKIIAEQIPEQQTIPGSKYRHYAPATSVSLIENYEQLLHENNSALLLTEEQGHTIYRGHLRIFSEQKIELMILGSMKNLDELARNFYQNLAHLDRMKVDKAFMLKNDWGATSLGKALQDRISRLFTNLQSSFVFIFVALKNKKLVP